MWPFRKEEPYVVKLPGYSWAVWYSDFQWKGRLRLDDKTIWYSPDYQGMFFSENAILKALKEHAADHAKNSGKVYTGRFEIVTHMDQMVEKPKHVFARLAEDAGNSPPSVV